MSSAREQFFSTDLLADLSSIEKLNLTAADTMDFVIAAESIMEAETIPSVNVFSSTQRVNMEVFLVFPVGPSIRGGACRQEHPRDFYRANCWHKHASGRTSWRDPTERVLFAYETPEGVYVEDRTQLPNGSHLMGFATGWGLGRLGWLLLRPARTWCCRPGGQLLADPVSHAAGGA
jgi:hypothetical protein